MAKNIFGRVGQALRKIGRKFARDPLVKAAKAVEDAADSLGDSIIEAGQELESELEDWINRPFKPFAKDKAQRRSKQAELRAKREKLAARNAAEAEKLRREESRRRQAKLRAKRKQIEYRNRREQYQAIKHDRSLPPSERAKRYQNYLRRYGKAKAPYPTGENREFWMRFREAGGS